MAVSLFHFPFKALGSNCELQIYTTTDQHAKKVFQLVQSDVLRIEQRYSRYRENNILSKINQVATQGGSLAVDEETLALINYADTCYQQSNGLFDITSGVLREIWDFKNQVIPTKQQIQDILPRIGWDKITLKNNILGFAIPGMQLDLGGIGKEYAVDRAATICQEQGIEHGLVDLGGDIKIIGPHTDGKPWSVGIRHPRKPEYLMASIEVSKGALASSGDYERCIIINGKRYSHILNPKTGWPVQGLSSITVIAEQCVIAGSLSTICMLKGKKGKQWIADLGVAHLWMDNKNNTGGTLKSIPPTDR